MRKLLIVAAGLLLVHAALLFAGGRGVTDSSIPGATNVGIVLDGIVFDLGGRGDKSFNDGAYAGADSAIKVLHPNIRFIEPGEGSDREAGLRLLAAEHMDLVIGVGFIFSDDLTKLAKEYPNVSFGGVDYALSVDDKGNVILPPPNLAALRKARSSWERSRHSSANRRKLDLSAEWTSLSFTSSKRDIAPV